MHRTDLESSRTSSYKPSIPGMTSVSLQGNLEAMIWSLLRTIRYSVPRRVAFPSVRMAFPDIAPGPGTVRVVDVVLPFDDSNVSQLLKDNIELRDRSS